MEKNQRGITLISLIVTVTVIFILVAVSIDALLGDEGLLGEAEEIQMDAIKTVEREYIRLAYQKIEMKLRLEGIEITPEEIEKELKKHDENVAVREIQESEINDKEIVVQRDIVIGYAEVTYTQTDNKYIVPLQEVVVADEIDIEIMFKYDHDLNVWTNEDIVATAETNATEYTLQTSLDGETWENTDTQTLKENGYVYARLINEGNQVGDIFRGEVKNIDNTPPEVGIVRAVRENLTTAETEEIFADEDGNFTTVSTVSTRTIQEIAYNIKLELVAGNDENSGHKSTTYTIKMNDTICYENIIEAVTLTGTSASSSRAIHAPDPAENYEIIVTTEDNAGNVLSKTYYINSSLFY